MRRTLTVLSALLVFSALSFAQTTFATITGTITDPTGLPLAGARISSVQVETGYKLDVRSNETGVYLLPNLREGAYNINVAAPGFKEFRAHDVVVASREVRRLDIRMEIGEVSTSVEVAAQGAAVIETDTARISQSRTSQELKDLPLNT